jgi:YD repeat-containing protein
MGRLTRILYPLSVTHEFRYDDVGNLTRFTNGEGDRTDYSYDARNRRASRRDHLDGVFSWTYALGLLSAQTDELNHTTQFGYDDAGQLISTTSPLNKLTTIGYDLAGRVTSVTDPLLRTWRWTYDAAGQLTQWTEPDPDGAGPLATPVTSVSYDAAGRLTAVTDPLGHATSYVYDNADQLTQVVEPDPDGAGPLASSITQFRYDRGGRRSSIIDPEGKPTDFTYNLLGWLVTVRQPDPDGGGPLARPLTSYEYYNSGLMLRVIDPNNNSTSYQYDDLHRLLRMTQTNGVSSVVTQFAYDRESRVTRVTDPYGNQTDFNYDRLGRTTRETDPKGEPIRYDYDAASNLTRITDREGRKREFVYDAADRLTTERWKTGAATVRTISYGYNDADELVSASDPDSSYAFTYYATGWLKTVNNAGTPLVPQVLLTYSYDAAGRRTRLDNTSGVTGLPAAVTAGFVKYDYDNADRVTRIQDGIVSAGSDAVRKQVDFTYNQRDQFSTIKRYLGAGTTLVTQASFTYDDIGRLTDLHHTRPAGTTLDRFQLTYDAGSRITSVVTTPTGAALTPFTTNFSYDRTDQLTGATSPVRNESYNYDLSGNRTASSSGSSG